MVAQGHPPAVHIDQLSHALGKIVGWDYKTESIHTVVSPISVVYTVWLHLPLFESFISEKMEPEFMSSCL